MVRSLFFSLCVSLPLSANACSFVVQVASGSEHMHHHGISHGDIKPQNILMFTGKDGSLVPQLADFGTARGEGLLAAVVYIYTYRYWHGNITNSTLCKASQ